MDTSNTKIGCCGFPLPKEKYAELFSVVEVQQTFYQPPQVATLQRWRELVPLSFEFTLKAWQLITHSSSSPTYRRLKLKLDETQLAQCGYFKFSPLVLRAWDMTLQCAEALRARCILFQCPASFTPTTEHIFQLRHFMSSINRHAFTFIWEPRGDWPTDIVRSLCSELQLIHAVDPFINETVTPKLKYFRLHGGKGFKHVYSENELQVLHNKIASSDTTYVMFNNIMMYKDASRFADRLIKQSQPTFP